MYKISGKMNKNRENIHEYAKTVEEKKREHEAYFQNREIVL